MFEFLSPLWILLAVFLGGVLSPLLGWARAYLNARTAENVTSTPVEREKLDWMRVLASAIIALIAAIIFFGEYSTAISVAMPELITAFVAGFGADKIVKNAIGI